MELYKFPNFIFVPPTCDRCGVRLGGGGGAEAPLGLHPYLCYLIEITNALCADTTQDLDKPKFFFKCYNSFFLGLSTLVIETETNIFGNLITVKLN